ncbi:hypothetical protein HYPSUDRAFT_129559 [Hypholoma sublateritium FD-334 SS-4]|uniref:Pyridoxamine 5'-phosphate oxidase Alr4036 family FMN-binding domain-containing protein n=1 Tax=Hypholoma sublateritium (strain FD-334 SS-4) TaxID=945553 RepID=A0A0D2Q9M4_HYPSF|nr:hypothetical protein HYPSUDRAFT_129559 [Hypholoma sublateritium FD-334 SS-4]
MASRIPGWKSAIEKVLNEYGEHTVIQIATLEKKSDRIVPRVRSHIFRSFLDCPMNAGLPLLLSSTDIRTPKVRQLTQDPSADIAWWIEPTKQQFRISCEIYLLPAPGHHLHAHFTDVLANANRETSLAQFKTHDWEETRQTMFKSMSAHMKASWCRPIPGSPLIDDPKKVTVDSWPERLEDPGSDVTEEGYAEGKRLWDIALDNFALVVIDPYEIDFVDLSLIPNERILFTKQKGSLGWWNEQKLVP